MIRHPLLLLAAKADEEGAHPVYHVAVRNLLRAGPLPQAVQSTLRADLPWMSAIAFTPEQLGFASIDDAAAAIEASNLYIRRTNHIDRVKGQIVQAPFVEEGAHVDARAELTGGVYVSRGVFIAPTAIVRMDEKDALEPLIIGEDTNLQDEVLVHAHDGRIGARCIVAHNAILHGAKLGDDVTVYIKAIVDTGAEIGDGAFIDAGAYVGRGVRVPPGRYVRPLQAVCTTADADALPPVEAAHRHMQAEVLRMNRDHARHYERAQREALTAALAS
jgi:carbonic anhydrase/acetyltransferase-like protein (isoleucine patch superfamily)